MNTEKRNHFGQYEIVKQIGAGGQAPVYLAFEPAINRYIALKRLPAILAATTELRRLFENEAKLIARLEHPNILPLYGFGITEDLPWMALRYADGGNFQQKLEDPTFTIEDCLATLHAVAKALDFAHSQKIVHRDVKPANILLTRDRFTYLADFGISKLLESTSAIKTETGNFRGSASYAAPEQIQGNPVSGETDVYSLATIYYQLFADTLPFNGDSVSTITLRAISQPVPTKPIAHLPRKTISTLLKGLEKSQKRRFHLAEELATSIENSLTENDLAELNFRRKRTSTSNPSIHNASKQTLAIYPRLDQAGIAHSSTSFRYGNVVVVATSLAIVGLIGAGILAVLTKDFTKNTQLRLEVSANNALSAAVLETPREENVDPSKGIESIEVSKASAEGRNKIGDNSHHMQDYSRLEWRPSEGETFRHYVSSYAKFRPASVAKEISNLSWDAESGARVEEYIQNISSIGALGLQKTDSSFAKIGRVRSAIDGANRTLDGVSALISDATKNAISGQIMADLNSFNRPKVFIGYGLFGGIEGKKFRGSLDATGKPSGPGRVGAVYGASYNLQLGKFVAEGSRDHGYYLRPDGAYLYMASAPSALTLLMARSTGWTNQKADGAHVYASDNGQLCVGEFKYRSQSTGYGVGICKFGQMKYVGELRIEQNSIGDCPYSDPCLSVTPNGFGAIFQPTDRLVSEGKWGGGLLLGMSPVGMGNSLQEF